MSLRKAVPALRRAAWVRSAAAPSPLPHSRLRPGGERCAAHRQQDAGRGLGAACDWRHRLPGHSGKLQGAAEQAACVAGRVRTRRHVALAMVLASGAAALARRGSRASLRHLAHPPAGKPHYAFPAAALSSITTRVTGCVLSGGASSPLLCASNPTPADRRALGASGDWRRRGAPRRRPAHGGGGGQVSVRASRALPHGRAHRPKRSGPLATVPIKFSLAFPIIFHTLSGFRHLVRAWLARARFSAARAFDSLERRSPRARARALRRSGTTRCAASTISLRS